jgi:hypothetical protein
MADGNKDGIDDVTGERVYVDVNNDGTDDVTGTIIPREASDEIQQPTLAEIIAAGQQKQYKRVNPNVRRPGEVIAAITVPYAEAIGQFVVGRTPEEIKKFQTQLKKIPGNEKIVPNGKLDNVDQVNSYIGALEKAWDSYSKLVTVNPNTNITDIGTFIDNTANNVTGKSTTTVFETLYLTSKPEAIQFYNDLYTNLTGGIPDGKKAEEFYKNLNVAERKAVQVQTTTTTGNRVRQTITKANIDELDKEQIALGIIGKEITADTLKNVGGQLGTNLKQIDSLLSDYNVRIDPKTRLEYLMSTAKSKTGLQDAKVKIQKLSALQNPALAPFIEADYKPSEVFGGFKSFKEQFYGQPSLSPNPWDDEDLRWIGQQQKLPSYDQWQSYLGNKPGAENTPGFRQKAATWADQVIKDLIGG